MNLRVRTRGCPTERRRCLHKGAVQVVLATSQAMTFQTHSSLHSCSTNPLVMISRSKSTDVDAALHLQQQLMYQSLDANREEIRLLTLYPPENDNAGLRCSLRSVALISRTGDALKVPSYEALSYVWGQPDFSSPILVNGQELCITPTLTTILLSLRRSIERTLWVDAICINQSNLAERAHQVTIMKKIYCLCQRVVAWLGPTLGTIRKRSEHKTDLPEDSLAADKA